MNDTAHVAFQAPPLAFNGIASPKKRPVETVDLYPSAFKSLRIAFSNRKRSVPTAEMQEIGRETGSCC